MEYGSLCIQWDNITVEGLASALYECLLELLKLQGYYNVYACVLSINEQSIRSSTKNMDLKL